MTGLLRAEWRKLTTTRMWIGLTVAAVLFTALNAGALAVISGMDLGGTAPPALTDPAAMRAVYSSAGSASVMALLLGIIAMTGEYRHKTITSTFVTTPRRGRVLAAKMLAQAFFGALLGLACAATTLLAVLAVLPFREHAPVDIGGFAAILAGVVLAFAIYAVLGVGLGSLLTNQIAAISVALIWVLLVESLIVSLWPSVGKWLPGGALNGVLQVESFFAGSYLDVAPAAGLLLLYGALFAGISAATTLRRDIT